MATGDIVFDPADLTRAQRAGSACVSCRKAWPRPSVRIGVIPDGTPVHACPECAVVLDRFRPDAAGAPAEPAREPAPAATPEPATVAEDVTP